MAPKNFIFFQRELLGLLKIRTNKLIQQSLVLILLLPLFHRHIKALYVNVMFLGNAFGFYPFLS